MRFLAATVSAYVAWRWIGFFAGLTRLHEYSGPPHREARRTVISRGALNVFGSVVAVYLWAFALELQLAETFVGFLAAMMMISLAIGVAAVFMQPEERTPGTLDVCRVIRAATRGAPPRP
ncbi:MAG: hypothetical protein ACRDKJ_05835 [Actinomycetota bacterium]